MLPKIPVAEIRREYLGAPLEETQVSADPMTQFEKWFQEVLNSQIEDANAMTLATVGMDGKPSARILLLKGISESGFSFFTNYSSRKGEELAHHPFGALVFYWKELNRQVRVEGEIEQIPPAESDQYFQSRPRESQISSWASPQSKVLDNRKTLIESLEKVKQRFASGSLPRPSFWGGYLLNPSRVEFWQGRPHRLHDRIEYKKSEEGVWQVYRLAP
ncbi:MAG: pyridoxamine 5'-phosphate oxidase [Chitinophagaceae bacterium]